MRVVCGFFAVIGGCALASATAVELAVGHPASVGWGFASAPLYLAGLVGVFGGRVGSPADLGELSQRASGRRVAAWLLAGGALDLVGTCLGDVLADVPGLSSSSAWAVSVFADIAGNASVVAGIGLIGLFPRGAPETRTERRVLRGFAAAAVLLPALGMVVFRTPAAALFEPAQPTVVSPLYVPALGFLAPVVSLLRYTTAAWVLAGLVLLYVGYRRGTPAERRLIRWLLAGSASALFIFGLLIVLSFLAAGPLVTVTIFALWGLGLVLILASLGAAVYGGGLLSIDEVTSRTVAYRTLWVLIALVYVAAATGLGIVASSRLPDWAAMLFAAAAALAFQPAQRRLERLADRWVFGRRLDGYQVITRFGMTLEASPGPADLLPRLAAAIRDGLALCWVRVRLGLDPAGPGDAAEADGMVAVSGIGLTDATEPAHVVPLLQADLVLGRIECGPRRDGPLLDEDRRLLAHLAAQAATSVSNVRLNAELADRLAVIERQAAELTVSRARLVKSTDDERRRIQRDLHDGPQQDLVVLSANLALARERLRRADPRADDTLAEVQADLAGLLARLREFAHAIHPPVLADQGLLEAIEAQASRMPLEVMVEADPELRGVRYPEQIETAAWYVVAEAMTNAVKHATAARVRIALGQPGGLLSVEVTDDGCGFDATAARGVGLTGLADRMAIVYGTLLVDSRPGQGTTLRAEIPLPDSPATGRTGTGQVKAAAGTGAAAGHG